MQNRYLDERTAQDIDKRISKILNDLDNPEPPLRLEQVRELLKLDVGYYSSSDTGAIAETIHRLKVAGKQVINRPSLLVDAIKKWDLKALWVPDRKRILLDSELPSAKQRWGQAHEIGHSVLPWHDAVMHGDMKRTLSLACEEQVESEANFAAGRLLFLRDVFVEHVRSSPLNFESVKLLSKVFGNTITSTLWHAVESTEIAAFGMVSQHPKHEMSGEPLRYFIRSTKFCNLFPGITAIQVFKALQSFCFGKRGPIGRSDVHLVDLNGAEHIFYIEVFFNGHEALSLGVHRHQKAEACRIGK